MRRKQYIDWLAAVFGIFGTSYGGYLLIWHYNHGNGFNPYALILLILGVISLSFVIAIIISRYIFSKKRKDNSPVQTQDENVKEEEKIKEEKSTEAKVEEKPKVEEKEETIQIPYKKKERYGERSSRPSYSYSAPSTIYVRLVGYGPMLRIEGSRILDMRNNTYYRIEGNVVYQEGSGPRFEIRGNQIRDVFGGYLYEVSGSNINKIYGGFYASISGSYITIHDLSRKYETSDSLSTRQTLVMAALLFDR